MGQLGNFFIFPLQDTFNYSKQLPIVNTQHDLLEAITIQIMEAIQLGNRPLLPQDSVDGICSTVWWAHEAHICLITAEENKVFNAAVAEAREAGAARAHKDNTAAVERNTKATKNYKTLQLECAQEQARLKVDSKFAHLLADKHSKLAPRVDRELQAEEHDRLIADHQVALLANLDSKSLDAEKEFVLAAAQ
ncbi:hypothetical protein V8E53_002605 [Lactarius tabidus]